MPFPSRRKYRPRRYRPRRPRGLAVVPRMMPRALARQRKNQVGTRVMWFKYNNTIDAVESEFTLWRANGPELLANAQFQSMCSIYDQYKVIGFKLRLFPANVGIESHDQFLGQDFTLLRGNHIVWTDQRLDPTVADPTSISQIINTASARMINPRRPYTVSLYRPRGQPLWGACEGLPPPFPPAPTATPDPWSGCIAHFYQDATNSQPGAPQALYFYTIQYKVVFRGRRQDQ